jgi:hypothetical protein
LIQRLTTDHSSTVENEVAAQQNNEGDHLTIGILIFIRVKKAFRINKIHVEKFSVYTGAPFACLAFNGSVAIQIPLVHPTMLCPTLKTLASSRRMFESVLLPVLYLPAMVVIENGVGTLFKKSKTAGPHSSSNLVKRTKLTARLIV